VLRGLLCPYLHLRSGCLRHPHHYHHHYHTTRRNASEWRRCEMLANQSVGREWRSVAGWRAENAVEGKLQYVLGCSVIASDTKRVADALRITEEQCFINPLCCSQPLPRHYATTPTPCLLLRPDADPMPRGDTTPVTVVVVGGVVLQSCTCCGVHLVVSAAVVVLNGASWCRSRVRPSRVVDVRATVPQQQ
jgi:hypothetical protein